MPRIFNVVASCVVIQSRGASILPSSPVGWINYTIVARRRLKEPNGLITQTKPFCDPKSPVLASIVPMSPVGWTNCIILMAWRRFIGCDVNMTRLMSTGYSKELMTGENCSLDHVHYQTDWNKAKQVKQSDFHVLALIRFPPRFFHWRKQFPWICKWSILKTMWKRCWSVNETERKTA